MSKLEAAVIRQLKKNLAELEALPKLPDLSSDEYEAKFRDLQRKIDESVYATIILLPDSVQALLSKIMNTARSRMDVEG